MPNQPGNFINCYTSRGGNRHSDFMCFKYARCPSMMQPASLHKKVIKAPMMDSGLSSDMEVKFSFWDGKWQ